MQFRDRIKGLVRVLPANLRPNPRNWRTHPKAQEDALRGVLNDLGIADAAIARELGDGTYELIDGHLRHTTITDQEIPVLVLDVNETEADLLLATIDPLAGMAETDPAKLQTLLAEVQTSSDAVAELLDRLAASAVSASKTAANADDVVEDEVPQPMDDAITQLGDIWILGNHRLMCGDSSKADELDRLLDGNTIHLVNTDPPYNVKVEPRSNNAIAAGLSSFSTTHHQSLDVARHPKKAKGTTKKMRAKDRPLANDFVTDEAFDQLLDAWFGNLARVLEPGRGFYIWGGYANCANYPPFLKKHELYFSQAVIWVKEHPVLTRKDFMGNHEWCFYGWRQGAAHQFFGRTMRATSGPSRS